MIHQSIDAPVILPWNYSWGEDAADAAAIGPPRVGIAVVGDIGRAGGGGTLPFPLGLRQSMRYIKVKEY